MASRQFTPIAERFARHVQITDNPSACWLWTGSLRNGYGQINKGDQSGGMLYAHRLAWELTYGPIPPAMCVCHVCDERRCCRPDHMFLGTKADNLADMWSKQRHQHGATHSAARLTDAQVRAILSSSQSARLEAARYGVTISAIRAIRRGRNWKHILATPPSAGYSGVLKGEHNPIAVLTTKQVRYIRRSTESGVVLAARFGVSKVTISHVRLRRSWKHVI
jgi:hypothetical protein